MRWLALYFPQLPLEVFTRGRQQAGTLAVVEQQGGRDRICRCNSVAQTYGIKPGLALPAALALHDELVVQRRAPEHEQAALQDLAAWAYQFSPRIAFDPALLLFEISASERLFGGYHALLRRVQREADQLGYQTQLALAPTPVAAGLLARQSPGVQVQDLDALHDAVRELPVSALTRDAGVRQLMRHIGLASIGDALGLPRPELARRSGPQLALLLDRLLGQLPDPRPEWQPQARFGQRIELLGELQQSTALVFPARRLMVALCGFLRGHGGGAQQLRWRLEHYEQADTHFDQGLLEPCRDADHMLEIFRDRIERLLLPAPVLAIGLQVDDWVSFEERNLTMFEEVASVDAGLLERLGNRLGEGHVRGLRCQSDHRPERAWRLCAPEETTSGSIILADASQPIWLLSQARPLSEQRGVPHYGGALSLEDFPQRIESGWWDGFDVTRDYFIAHSAAGERLWVFRDRRRGGWYLHGLFV